MTKVPQDASAEEPDGGNLQVRLRRGPGSGDRPGLLNTTLSQIRSMFLACRRTIQLYGVAAGDRP